MQEVGRNPDLFAEFVPREFGSNSRWIGWLFHVDVSKDSAGALTISCSYSDQSGKEIRRMPKTLSVGPQEKGHKWASSGFGNEAGTFWKPGEYLLSCEVNGTVITQAAFRVTDASIFFLERHKTVNVAALVMTEGLAGNPHWYLGELRVTHNGIEWHESYKWLDRAFGPRWIEISKSTADFQAACGSFKIGLDSRTLRGKKADVITVIQGNQTMELATDVGEGERVVAGVRDGCSTR